MEFEKTEAVFFASVALCGVAGGLIRHWRDGGSVSFSGAVGRVLSSGLVAFGVIGYWVGDDTSTLAGPFHYLAISALIGYLSQDLQEKILNKLVTGMLERAGLIEKEPKPD